MLNRIQKFLNVDEYNKKIVLFGVIASFIIGIFLIIIKYPLSGYDEWTHVIRVMQLANGDFKIEYENDNGNVGGYIYMDENDFVVKTSNVREDCYDPSWILDDTFADNNQKIFRGVTNTIPYNPISYLPYIIVSFFCHLLNIYPVYEYLLMRIAGFLFFFFIYLLAIRKSKEAKIPLSLFLLSPYIITSFTSVTSDNYGLVISILWLVMVFEAVQTIAAKEPIENRDFIGLLICSVLVVFSKIPNCIFLGLMLPVAYLIYKNYKDIKKSLILTITLVLEAVFTLAWLALVGDVNTGKFWARDVDTMAQVKYILSDFGSVIKMFVEELISFDYSEIQIGYAYKEYHEVPLVLGVCFYIGIYMACRMFTQNHTDGKKEVLQNHTEGKKVVLQNQTEGDGVSDSKIFTYFGIALSVLYVVLINVIMYLQYSEVGTLDVVGTQARYFLASYFFIFLLISYYFKKRNYKNYVVMILTAMPMLWYFALSIYGLAK